MGKRLNMLGTTDLIHVVENKTAYHNRQAELGITKRIADEMKTLSRLQDYCIRAVQQGIKVAPVIDIAEDILRHIPNDDLSEAEQAQGVKLYRNKLNDIVRQLRDPEGYAEQQRLKYKNALDSGYYANKKKQNVVRHTQVSKRRRAEKRAQEQDIKQ